VSLIVALAPLRSNLAPDGAGAKSRARRRDGDDISAFSSAYEGRLSALQREAFASLLAEYDFRYNHRIALGFDDRERATLAVKNAAGKRLTYRGAREARF
jgi:hypothetical protein